MAVDTKKEQEREELHRAIWAIADELCGAVDSWDFKNYVLGTMFYRYIFENLTDYINARQIQPQTPAVRSYQKCDGLGFIPPDKLMKEETA